MGITWFSKAGSLFFFVASFFLSLFLQFKFLLWQRTEKGGPAKEASTYIDQLIKLCLIKLTYLAQCFFWNILCIIWTMRIGMDMVPLCNQHPISCKKIGICSTICLNKQIYFIQDSLTFSMIATPSCVCNVAVGGIPNMAFFANVIVTPKWCNCFSKLCPVIVRGKSIRIRESPWFIKWNDSIFIYLHKNNNLSSFMQRYIDQRWSDNVKLTIIILFESAYHRLSLFLKSQFSIYIVWEPYKCLKICIRYCIYSPKFNSV